MEGHAPSDAIDFDPFDATVGIPHDLLTDLRERCPVAPIPVGWYLTRHADVAAAVRDIESFRSSYREPGVVVPDEEQLLPEMPEPRHGKVRRIVNAVVGWHKVVRVEQFVRHRLAVAAVDVEDRQPPDRPGGHARRHTLGPQPRRQPRQHARKESPHRWPSSWSGSTHAPRPSRPQIR